MCRVNYFSPIFHFRMSNFRLPMPAERLQKIIAAAGVASRRKAEELIAAGRVTLNGAVVTEQGTKAEPETDKIAVDGKPLRKRIISIFRSLQTERLRHNRHRSRRPPYGDESHKGNSRSPLSSRPPRLRQR